MSAEGFHWLRPEWFFALLPLLFLLWHLRRTGGDGGAWAARLCDPHLLPHLLQTGGGGTRGRLPMALLTVGWLLAVLALAGPVWQRLPQPLFQSGGTRVVLLDLSYSMNARDLTPTRLERARLKILELLRRNREGEVALLAYAGEAHIVAPLTNDAATLAALVPVLSPEVMPVAGSRPAQALTLADQMLEKGGHARGGELLLLTDGIDEPGAVAEVVRTLRAKGRRLSILGVGTPEGAPVPRPDGGFFSDGQGKVVVARLEEAPLQQFARAGGGVYQTIRADAADLEALLVEGEPMNQGADGEKKLLADQWREEGPWLVVLLLPLAALAFRRGWLGVVVLGMVVLAPDPAQAFSWGDPWRTPDQQGAALLEQGEAGAAAQRFIDPLWQGAAHYRAGAYAEAVERFAQGDDALAHYNRGNALARLERLEEAVSAYETALQRDPDHQDARHNLELVKKLIEEKKREQEKKEPEKKEKKPEQTEQCQMDPKKEGGEKEGEPQAGDEQKEGEQKEDSAAAGQQNEQGDPSAPKEEQKESTASDRQEKSAQEAQQAQGATPRQDPKQEESQTGTAQPQPVSPRQDEPKPLPDPKETAPMGSATPQERESEQATRQWLRRIPEDPGGLLRQKFSRQAQRRAAQGAPPFSGQPW